jgi:hypothetical protein
MGDYKNTSAPRSQKDGSDGHADPIQEKKKGLGQRRASLTLLISTGTALVRSTRGKKGGLDSRPPPS